VKTRIEEPPARRTPIASAIVIVLVIVAAGIYLLHGSAPAPQANGPRIFAAAQAYARALHDRHQPIPHSVPLQTLLDQGYLRPADAGPFNGLEAYISLVATNGRPLVLMQVRMPDGQNLLLLPDGSMQPVKQ
jgi:hypothetical protein